jgi:hypothetical protein
MDQEQEFYKDSVVDHTPYSAFTWVIATAVVFTVAAGVGLWHLGSAFKAQGWLRSDSPNTTERSLPAIPIDGTDEILNRAREAAQQAAQDAARKAADDAASRATQEILQRGAQEIKRGSEAAAPAGQDLLQQFLNQP